MEIQSLTRTDLEEWWGRVPGARRFMKTIGREVEQSRALAIDIADSDAEDFFTAFTDAVQKRNYSLVLERLDLEAGESADEFVTALATRFEPHYMPDLLSGSVMTDVARKKILSGYVVSVRVEGRAMWLSRVIDDFNRVEELGKGSILFFTSGLPSQLMLRLTDFITPYDVQFFSINMMECTPLRSTQKLYTATLTAKLAGTSAVMAKNLSSVELYTNGRRFVEGLLGEERRRDYERAVWETQIQFALPIVETVREKLIARNLATLKGLLPVTDEFGKALTEPRDMELRHLHYYGGRAMAFSLGDWEVLEAAYRARNVLTHLDILEREQLEEIFSLADF